MLTDIFARRYETVTLWKTFAEPSRRLIVQSYQLAEQIVPFADDPSDYAKRFWTNVHLLLAREFGVKELSPSLWGYWSPQKQWVGGKYSIKKMCENWMLAQFDGGYSADNFIKERLSFVEIFFRTRGAEIAKANAELPDAISKAKLFDSTRSERRGMFLPGNRADGVRAANLAMNAMFQSAVDELNTRLRQSGCDLHYHNGFIQVATDPLTTALIDTPFWNLVSDPKWKNVDHDLKEAIDLRDSGGRDPAFYAARALESAIKIISDEKKLTTSKERGAHNFIDNLLGAKFIEQWEGEALKAFFTKVRNPLSHGPGSDDMPRLSSPQTTWAIETSMCWLKSLIVRL